MCVCLYTNDDDADDGDGGGALQQLLPAIVGEKKRFAANRFPSVGGEVMVAIGCDHPQDYPVA